MMTFRRCRYRSTEWTALRAQGFLTIAVSKAGIALLLRLETR